MAPEIIIAELAEPSDARAAVPFGVPRRFGVGTILVVTAAFAQHRSRKAAIENAATEYNKSIKLNWNLVRAIAQFYHPPAPLEPARCQLPNRPLVDPATGRVEATRFLRRTNRWRRLLPVDIGPRGNAYPRSACAAAAAQISRPSTNPEAKSRLRRTPARRADALVLSANAWPFSHALLSGPCLRQRQWWAGACCTAGDTSDQRTSR